MRTIKTIRMFTIAILCIFTIAVCGGTLCANAESPKVYKRSQEEIRTRMQNTSATTSLPVTYKVKPVANTVRGELSPETQNSAITLLNNIRYVAGLDQVTYDESYAELAQAAAFVNMSIGIMTHAPASVASKPAAMSQADWDLGCKGAAGSNIAAGRLWLRHSIFAWVDDSDSTNIKNVGHRVYCLNPKMRKTGFGLAGSKSAMYVTSESEGGIGVGFQTNIAWPAQNTPIEYFSNGATAWSLSDARSVRDISKVTVTLTRRNDGRKWVFKGTETYSPQNLKYFRVSNGGSSTIVFRPDGILSYNDGDIFDVVISETGREDITYTVNFFCAIPITKIAFDESHIDLKGKGDESYVWIKGYPEDSGEYIDDSLLKFTSSNKAVVTVDKEGNIRAVGKGSAVITATYKGMKATMTVKVGGSKSRTIRDLPVVKLSKLKASKKAITVKWKKISKKNKKKIQGIEIQYSRDGFKTIAGTKRARKTKTSYKIKGLKSGKKYWVRIRAYKNTKKGKHVSAWKTRKIKVK